VSAERQNRMARQKCIPLDSPAEWKEALVGIGHAFSHTWENCYAMHLTTGFRTYLYCFEAENVRIVCPIAEREFDGHIDIVTPFGFSGFAGNKDYPEFPRYWRNFVKERGYVCGYIALHPRFENSTYFNHSESYSTNSLYFLDLTPPLDQIFANLDRNRKRQLKKWEELVSGFILDKSVLTEFLVTNYPDFIRRMNASPANYFSVETLRFLCDLDNVFMVGTGTRGSIEAVYVFAYTAQAAECLFNVAFPEGRRYTTALLWFGLNRMVSLKVPLLNLGGGIREDDSIADSKQRFGSRKIPFKCLKQIYRPRKYEELCRQANVDRADLDGYFPAYRSLRDRDPTPRRS